MKPISKGDGVEMQGIRYFFASRVQNKMTKKILFLNQIRSPS